MAGGKWESKIPKIKAMAGEFSTEEIAAELGTSVNNLHKICHRNGIRLPRDPSTYNGGRPGCRRSIEQAKVLLIRAGYRVLPPDPFSRSRENGADNG